MLLVLCLLVMSFGSKEAKAASDAIPLSGTVETQNLIAGRDYELSDNVTLLITSDVSIGEISMGTYSLTIQGDESHTLSMTKGINAHNGTLTIESGKVSVEFTDTTSVNYGAGFCIPYGSYVQNGGDVYMKYRCNLENNYSDGILCRQFVMNGGSLSINTNINYANTNGISARDGFTMNDGILDVTAVTFGAGSTASAIGYKTHFTWDAAGELLLNGGTVTFNSYNANGTAYGIEWKNETVIDGASVSGQSQNAALYIANSLTIKNGSNVNVSASTGPAIVTYGENNNLILAGYTTYLKAHTDYPDRYTGEYNAVNVAGLVLNTPGLTITTPEGGYYQNKHVLAPDGHGARDVIIENTSEPIRLLDIGNISTDLFARTGIAFTTVFDSDGMDGKMSLTDQYWKDNETGDEIHAGDTVYPTVGHSYTFYVKISPKDGYYFPDGDFDLLICEGSKVAPGSYEKTAEEDGSIILTWGLAAECIPIDLESADANLTIEGVTDRTYNGEPQLQSPVLKVSAAEQEFALTEEQDYTVSYENNINAGQAAVVLTGTGDFTGTVRVDFQIGKKALTADMVTLTPESSVWTGELLKPAVTVTDGSATLSEGIDYQLTNEGGIAAGTYPVVVDADALTGSNYSGVIEKSFTIDPAAPEVKNGWIKEDGKWYYYTENEPAIGWKQISGKWYYFDQLGIMQTGWQKISNKWYYFRSSGAMQTGWQKISNKWYYFKSSGAMQTGWLTIGDKTYYLKSNGVMAAKEWCKGYWLNKDGTWTYPYKASWKQNSKGWWYGDTSGWYAKNTTIIIDGKSYSFDAKGYLM